LRKFPKNLPNSPKHQETPVMTAVMTAEETAEVMMIPTPIPTLTLMRLTQYLIPT
jgi:hypothetical protein